MGQETRKDNKRCSIQVNPGFQKAFFARFCTLVAIGGVATIGIIYALAKASTTVAILHSRVMVRSTADFILPLLAQTVVIVLVVVSIAAVMGMRYLTHKVFGPLHRLKGVLCQLGKGDFTRFFSIRKGDHLQDIVEPFNDMIAHTRNEIKSAQDAAATLEKKLPEGFSQEAKDALRQLQQHLGNFKV